MPYLTAMPKVASSVYEATASIAELGGEDAPVVRQHRGGEPPGRGPLVEGSHHVRGGRHRDDHGRHHHPRVVVHEVDDLDTLPLVGPVVDGPVGHVGLPGLVGQGRLEALPGGPRSLLGLGGDEPPADEGPVDSGPPGGRPVALRQVVLDRQGAGVQPFLVQLLAHGDDLVLELERELGRSPVRCGRDRHQCLVTAVQEPGDLFGYPGFRHVDRRGHRSDGPALHQHGIDGIAGTIHGHHLSRCPRCPGTWCPLSHGTGHHHLHRTPSSPHHHLHHGHHLHVRTYVRTHARTQ